MALFPNMRVLIVAKPWHGGLGDYVHRAAVDLLGAHNVTNIATRPTTLVDKFARARDRKGWEQQLVQRIENANYDAAIFIQPPKSFSALTKSGKNILWLVDDARVSDGLLKSMGHIFISDPGYEAEAKQVIPPTQYAGVLPFAMLPELHAPAATSTNPSPMCFIANRDAKRSEYLANILGDVNCHIYGNYFLQDPLFWKHPLSFRPAIDYRTLAATYAQHRISLNIHAAVVRGGTNMRTYEAAGCGIAQLVEHRDGIEELFDIRNEILCFKNSEELKNGYARLMNDSALAKSLAEKSHARVLAEHTYQHRVKTILSRI